MIGIISFALFFIVYHIGTLYLLHRLAVALECLAGSIMIHKEEPAQHIPHPQPDNGIMLGEPFDREKFDEQMKTFQQWANNNAGIINKY